MRTRLSLLSVVLAVAVLLGGLAGHAFADHHSNENWESRKDYQSDTLYGQRNGRPWSPTDGVASGQVHYGEYWSSPPGGEDRQTLAEASFHIWNETALAWMRSNPGTPSITTHVFDYDGSCPQNWRADWVVTNLPGPTALLVWRCSIPDGNEVRVQTNKDLLVAGAEYLTQVSFVDPSRVSRGKFTIDTYWDSDGNYHQHFCVPVPPSMSDLTADRAVNRGVSGCPS